VPPPAPRVTVDPMAKRLPPTPIELEILGERTRGLARSTEALAEALEALARAEAALAGAAPPPGALTEERQRALAEAADRLWRLVVQREAAGILRHEILYEALRVPAQVRAAMGRRAGVVARRRREP
jgi:hypothetical protein